MKTNIKYIKKHFLNRLNKPYLNKEDKEFIKLTFEILENQSNVKVMGPSIFESFSTCLDNALRITKGVLIGGLALFITTIFL